ncbi:MAG TPA: hypothetical protein VH595_02780 [Verrucomicrobiae bacterium]|nr:hypothetical protein [Verrucomicrobiae bacterium]
MSIALAVYMALTEIASDKQSETFETTLLWIALMAGASVSSVKRIIPDLEAISIINVRRTQQGGKGPSTYSLLSIVQAEPSKVQTEPSIALSRNTPSRAALEESKKKKKQLKEECGDAVASPRQSLDLAGSEEEPEVFPALSRILLANLLTPGTSRRWMALVRSDPQIFNESFEEYERTLRRGGKVTSPLDWIEATCEGKGGSTADGYDCT